MPVWLVLLCAVPLAAAAAAEYRLAHFEADVTPPKGHACMGGGIAPVLEIEDPLFARGIVLLGGAAPLVLVSVDWCEIRNGAYDDWRRTLAEAAGSTPERVLVSCVHQHDAPVVDYEAQALLDGVGLGAALCDVAFARRALAGVAGALRASLGASRLATHYGVGVARVEGIASNRRIVTREGAVAYHRGSTTRDPALRDQPEGIVDPLLRTLSFWDGDTPLAALSVYATHPMSHYGAGKVSADFPGLARARRQADEAAVRQIYFSGCAGDVTAGKYNDGEPSRRAELAGRLGDAMRRAWQATRRYPLEAIGFRSVPLHLAPKEEFGHREVEQRRVLADPGADTFQRNLAALGLSHRARAAAGRPIDVPALDFGEAIFMLLPAESFVHYAIAAQAMRPDRAVLVAGYGECAPGYIPTAAAGAEGFHAESWCWVAPGCEPAMLAALRAALSPG